MTAYWRAFLGIFALSILTLSAIASGPPISYVQSSTNTLGVQAGGFNISSGTVNTLLAVPYVTGTQYLMSINGNVTGTSVNPAGAFIGAQSVLQSGATFYVSSGTVNNFNVGASFNGGGFQLNNVLTPSLATDVATKGYVDTLANGSTNYIQNTSSLQSGATFYVSSGTINNLNISTNVAVAGNTAYLLLYSSTVYDTSGSSATTGTVFVPTKTLITITPKRITSRIEISWYGDLTNTGGSSANSFLGLFRNGSNLIPSGGSICIVNGPVAGNTKGTCSGELIDMPATTSPITYTLYMKDDAGGATATWNGNASSIASMTVKEWSY